MYNNFKVIVKKDGFIIKGKFLKSALATSLAITMFSQTGHFVSAEENSAVGEKEGFLDLNSSDVVVKDNLTFDELVAEMANDQNISLSEAEKLLNEDSDNNRNNLLQQNSSSPFSSNSLMDTRALPEYATITKQIRVTATYKPSLKFYCQVSTSGSFHGIQKIKKFYMNRVHAGVTKRYAGKFYVNLEDPNRIHYILDGDFYNNGTVSGEMGGEVGLKKSSTLQIKVSGASDHYAGVGQEGNVRY